MRPHFLSSLILFALTAANLSAALPVVYDASAVDPDPTATAQGWTASGLTPQTGLETGPPVAWRLADTSSSDNPAYTHALTSGEANGLLNTTGFKMTAVIRAVANHNSQFGGQDWSGFLEFRFSTTRRVGFAIGVDVDVEETNNNFQIFNEQNTTTPTIVAGSNTANDFHTLEVFLCPGATDYSWFLNGDHIATLPLNGGPTNTFTPLVGFANGTTNGVGGTFHIQSFRLEALNPKTIHVDVDAAGANDGTSWADAYPTLQDALKTARPGDEIWVAQGTYYPDEGTAQTQGNRSATFQLKSGVEIYGGFTGTETELSARDISANPTILSGDLDQDDNSGGDNSENAYHVVTGNNIDSTALLDGFTVTAGRGATFQSGAGLSISDSDLIIRNCHFDANTASFGGAMSIFSSSPTIENCEFTGNHGSQNGGAVEISDSSPIFTNCVFTNNEADAPGEGGAIYTINSNSPQFSDCLFNLNNASRGGAFYSKFSTPEFTRCQFVENSSADKAGALFLDESNVPLLNCAFRGNEATNDGGAVVVEISTPTFTNTLFSGNRSGSNGGAVLSTSAFGASYLNCTFSGNDAGGSGGAMHAEGGSPQFINSLLWNNRDTAAGQATDSFSSNASSPSYSHTLVQHLDLTVIGTNNFAGSEDPLFIQPLDPTTAPSNAGDFQLGATSPLRDAGNSAANSTTTDLAGNTREINTAIDLGAYETLLFELDPLNQAVFQSPGRGEQSVSLFPDVTALSPTLQYTLTLTANPGSLVIIGTPRIDPDGVLYLGMEGGALGTLSFDVLLSDSAGVFFPSPVVTLTIRIGNRLHVDETATGMGNGHIWNDAFTDLQSALAAALPQDEIWVASGNYYPDEGSGQTDNNRASTFQLKNEVALYGGFAGTESSISERDPDPATNGTILSGDLAKDDSSGGDNSENAYHVVTGSGTNFSATLNGFTISGGNANGSGEILGGGLLNSNGSPSLSNCSLQNNFAGGGGAISNTNDSSPSLTNCSFQDNSSAQIGGAIYNFGSSSPSLENCSFQGNFSNDEGGAIFNISDSSPSLTNCSFQGNSAFNEGGAIYNFSSSPSHTNCSFQGNSANLGGAIYNDASSPTLTNCSFQDNFADDEGGAIYNNFANSPSLSNCIIWNNSASGVTTTPSASVYNQSDVNSSSYFYCLIENWSAQDLDSEAGGTGNLDGTLAANDPLFANPATGDLRLLTGSPAIDAGDNSANTTDSDLASNPRILSGTIDLGAYEFGVTFADLHPTLDPTADTNGNGFSNYYDYATGADPTAPHDPAAQPSLTPDLQLQYRHRNNAYDVFTTLEKSTSLLPGSWDRLFENPDYTPLSTVPTGAVDEVTLQLLFDQATDPRVFVRMTFSTTPQ